MGKGLFRLWLLLTVLWMGLILLVSVGDTQSDVMEVELQMALIPPAALLIVSLMLASMFAGFLRR